MKISPMILEVPVGSQLGHLGIELMNEYHEKRICQESLDLYRGGYAFLLDPFRDSIFFMIALNAGQVIGLTACVVKDNEVHNSITVTHKICRGKGVASALMAAKVRAVNLRYPNVPMTTKVAIDNAASIAACKKAGLTNEVKLGTDDRGDKRTNYVILGYPVQAPKEYAASFH